MSENVAPSKTKSQLRAERRAVQEAQRAAKATAKTSGNQQQQQLAKSARKKSPSESTPARSRSRDKQTPPVQQSAQSTQNVDTRSSSEPDSGQRGGSQDAPSRSKQTAEVHSAFAQLALRFGPDGSVKGADAQCLAVIDAFRQLAIDYHAPSDKAFSREFENAIKPCISRISGSRSLPPAIASLVKQLKLHLSTISNDTAENEARELVISWLEDFADRNIVLSTRAIAESVAYKLKLMASPMVVMVYTFSATVEKTLMEAHRQGVAFEVVIVDSMPKKEGMIMVRRLSSVGIKCQYVLLTGMAAVLRRVNVVLLGAEGLLANGNVVAALGSTQVAMTANARNVPVLVLCHTYKFCEKVFTVTSETDWPDTEVMPAEFVTGVVTELRTLPCSAVPAVLRVKQLGGGIA